MEAKHKTPPVNIESDEFWNHIIRGNFGDFRYRPLSNTEWQSALENRDPKGIRMYIHIGFCKGFCKYCAFTKHPWNPEKAEAYVEALKKEIEHYAGYIGGTRLLNVYIGGGTPSLLETHQIESIIETIDNYFKIRGKIGIEGNPEDLTKDKIKDLAQIVDKISIGVQTFNDKYLKILARRHGSKRAQQAIADAVSFFNDVNIDLMHTLPGQTLEEWKEDLRTALQFDIPQLTVYPLIYIPYTRIYREIEQGKLPAPSRDDDKKMYFLSMDMLKEHGYNHVWMYAYLQQGKDPYLTTDIQLEKDHIGIGVAASSSIGGYDLMNTHSLDEYIKCVSKKEKAVVLGRKILDAEKMWRWFISRLCQFQFTKVDFRRKFGRDVEECLGEAFHFMKNAGIFTDKGTLVKATKQGNYIINKLLIGFIQNIFCLVAEECRKKPRPEYISIAELSGGEE